MISSTARAQDPTPQPPAQPTPTAVSTAPVYAGGIEDHWTLSGFVGSNFGASATDHSLAYGGQIGYLWHGIIGGEVITEFAPTFKIDNVFFIEKPKVASYMANVIGALPLGSDGRIQPYLSGGIGGIQLRSTVINSIQTPAAPQDTAITIGTTTSNQTRIGTNVGGGLMAFTGKFGVRADVRYYRSSDSGGTTANTPADLLTQSVLSGLDFWRGNVGVAFRW